MRLLLHNHILRLILLTFLIAFSVTRTTGAGNLSSPASLAPAVSVASLPINFEPNYGQAANDARFLARTGTVEMDLHRQGFSLRLAGRGRKSAQLTADFVGARKT